MKLKLFITIMAACLVTAPTSALAAKADFTTSTKNTTKIGVRSVNYDYDESDDDIDIDFTSRIKLKSSAKATVKDSTGKSYTAYIEDYDRNEIDLDVSNLKPNKKYTVTISGIKKSTASKYGTLSVKFSIPKASTNLVKDVDYDAEDREVTFEFKNNVSYKNAKIIITNTSNTKSYTSTIVEQDSDELCARVSGLTSGRTYKYKITGVTSLANGSTKTLSGTFTAVDND